MDARPDEEVVERACPGFGKRELRLLDETEDDVDDVPPPVQAKMLRVLEAREVMRVGGTTPIPVDVRLISASKVDLKEMVSRNLFRADLYYRINVLPLEIPPLRDRPEDIVPLIEHFLRRFAGEKPLRLAPSAVQTLTAYRWPGNVRELRNVAQRVALFAEGEIRTEDLPPELQDGHPLSQLVRACARCLVDESLAYTDVIDCLETNLLRQALQASNGNRSQAAKSLGLSLSTLRDKLRKFGLNDDVE